MIASLARLAFAPFTLLFDWADRHCAELESTALADAAECPEEIEPPEGDAEVPSETDPVSAVIERLGQPTAEPEPADEYNAQELVTEIVLDAANERAWEHGLADLELWEDERIAGLVERRRG